MHKREEKSSAFPKSGVSSGYLLWEVHCFALEIRAPSVQVSWVSSLALRILRQRPCSSSGRRGRCCRGYRRGDVPRVLQARALSWSRSGPLPRVVPMPF